MGSDGSARRIDSDYWYRQRIDGRWRDVRGLDFDHDRTRMTVVRGPYAGHVVIVNRWSPYLYRDDVYINEPAYAVTLEDGKWANVRWDEVEGAPPIPYGATEPWHPPDWIRRAIRAALPDPKNVASSCLQGKR